MGVYICDCEYIYIYIIYIVYTYLHIKLRVCYEALYLALTPRLLTIPFGRLVDDRLGSARLDIFQEWRKGFCPWCCSAHPLCPICSKYAWDKTKNHRLKFGTCGWPMYIYLYICHFLKAVLGLYMDFATHPIERSTLQQGVNKHCSAAGGTLKLRWKLQKWRWKHCWLVVWNIFIFPNSWYDDPIWLSYFPEG